MEENKQDETLMDETTVNEAVEVDAVETVDTTANKANRKRLTVIIAAVCAVVLVAAGVGGWVAWSRHELSVAQDDCAQASQTVKSVRAEYARLVAGDDVKTASAVTVEQVKDAKTVETLAAAVKASVPKSVACPVKDVKAVQAMTGKLKEQAKWFKTHKASLSKAVKQVNSSKLDKIIDDANTLLADSDGKVADNATRDELSKAIEAKAEQAIADATAKVNDSIAAKTKADEEAAAKAKAEEESAAQAAAAAAQQSYNYGSANGSTSSGSSSGSSSWERSLASSGAHGVDCGNSCNLVETYTR